MFGIEIQRGVHGPHPLRGRLAAVQQMQEVRADRIIVRLHLDAPFMLRKVMPVTQHRSQTRQ